MSPVRKDDSSYVKKILPLDLPPQNLSPEQPPIEVRLLRLQPLKPQTKPTMKVLLELYNHTNHQVAAHNIWETSWPAYIEVLAYINLPLLPPLSHSLGCWHNAVWISLS
jgi:hypothetical protein